MLGCLILIWFQQCRYINLLVQSGRVSEIALLDLLDFDMKSVVPYSPSTSISPRSGVVCR